MVMKLFLEAVHFRFGFGTIFVSTFIASSKPNGCNETGFAFDSVSMQVSIPFFYKPDASA